MAETTNGHGPVAAATLPASEVEASASGSAEASAGGSGLLRSAIDPTGPPAAVALDGWLVSARPASGELRLIDCSPLGKLVVQAPPAGVVADQLAVPVGRAELFEGGLLAACPAPGEWLVLCATDPADFVAGLQASAAGEPISAVDVTQGRTVLRLTGPEAADVVTELCELDLSSPAFPPGSATWAPVAGVRTAIVRDDLFTDEAGWPSTGATDSADAGPPPAEVDEADVDADAGAGADDPPAAGAEAPAGDVDPDSEDEADDIEVRSYLLCCDRSAGRHLYERLLEAGRVRGIEEEGFALHRARRSEL